MASETVDKCSHPFYAHKVTFVFPFLFCLNLSSPLNAKPDVNGSVHVYSTLHLHTVLPKSTSAGGVYFQPAELFLPSRLLDASASSLSYQRTTSFNRLSLKTTLRLYQRTPGKKIDFFKFGGALVRALSFLLDLI